MHAVMQLSLAHAYSANYGSYTCINYHIDGGYKQMSFASRTDICAYRRDKLPHSPATFPPRPTAFPGEFFEL